MIPNEKLAGGVLKNDTLKIDLVALDVAVWVPPEADVERAITALEDETGQEVSVAEAVPWGTRLAVGSDPVSPPDRAPAEAALRRQCLKTPPARRLAQRRFNQADLESLVRP